MNAYEKVFLERINKLQISPGPDFAALAREALEKEWGGQSDTLLGGIGKKSLESPKKLASALTTMYGDGAMQFFKQILKYAEAKSLNPEDQESEQEEGALESVIQEIKANTDESEY